MPKTNFVSDLDDKILRCLVEALTESGQAVSIFIADDNLQYANKTTKACPWERTGPFYLYRHRSACGQARTQGQDR